jgi:signal transduction histidine kinase/ActR/RegA family two-component response regulator
VIAYGVGRNITAEKNAESRYSETVRELLSLSPNALCTFRLNLTKNLCSEEHGTSQYIEKLIFSDTADNLFANIENIILDQEQKESFKAVFSRPTLIAAFEKGQSRFSLKYRRLVESGDTHWVRTSLNMFLNPTTNDLEAIIYSVDIDYSVTEESIIDCIINEEFDALALIDTKKGTVSFKSVSPQSVDTLPNKEPIYDDDIRYAFPLVDPDNWQADIDSLNLAHLIAELKTKSIYSYAFNVCDSKNQTFRKILKFCYLDDSHNEILLCRSDITEEFASHNKQLAETKAALEEAEKANQSKSVFLSNVSHDMRTPLNGIIGYISLAQKENKDPKVSDYLKKASFSSDILLKLVNDTLDLNKLENGKVTISNEPVETSDLIAKISDAVQVSMAQKSIVFKMDYDEKENMKINADPLVIDEIFINLLSNAVKFTPENGHITMSAHPVKIEKGIVTWRIAIKDDGVGMSDDFLNNHIFEPFSQERTKATSKIGGSGLGLSIVKHLVAICGGTITVHSEVGKGTEFVINMPHELLDQHPERKGGESRQDKRVSDLSSLVGKKVLLVEDNEMNSEIAASVLSAKGLVVDCASDGTEAVSHFAFSGKNEYSVILMDIRMPVLNGYEATKQIRQLSRPDAKTIPIIAMSADAYAEDVKKSLEAGMNDHISKPLDPEKLFAALLKFVK